MVSIVIVRKKRLNGPAGPDEEDGLDNDLEVGIDTVR